ncbi:asparaginase [Pseudonocardia sp. GCM10023141]|uniref:asparaginase n=1 Tax=Pseudonocardia sp. GCM10023141 TaxID=3252653 RepID=UPI00360E6E5F
MIDENAQPLAHVVRGGLVESVHLGHLVALDATGAEVLRRGDPGVTFYPRSSVKPVQAIAMLRAGLDLDGELLALAASSNSGEPAHVEAAREILAKAGLTEADLQNTPVLPINADASFAWRAAGNGPSSLTQDCSGKHAAMLTTCVVNGWDLRTYRDPAHPLQQAIRATIAEFTGDGDPAHVTVDGCGAPLFSCTVGGLARAFSRIATGAPGTPEHRVATAMRNHPWFVGGTGRRATRFMETVPGLIAKDGADGVLAAALPDGAALAVKILDGSGRSHRAVVAGALAALGVTGLDEIGHVDVLGHGEPVGAIVAV